MDFQGDNEAFQLLGEAEMKATNDGKKALEAYWKACNYGSAQGCEEKKAVCLKISGDSEDWVKRVCATK